ncbi:nuclear transport factor 2 family protein [Pedobacter frigidisoli]|uniref:Nuclear transport factor 2 family protein n=1 Tax=Pedobacter frigidisoli TaxID=2530455 RepID=A0A4R0P7U4_9SPHI|nr:nuclear transport factor 2 family protein [Pedobacter frigidisoli]TCD10628.1 nuclear transport factor 2 family protein [Pedobacter frigidisoli]
MSLNNKQILEKANAAISAGDHEGFLALCTDDTEWTFVGDQTLIGKESVRAYMKIAYLEPPIFVVEKLIAEDEFVTAIGTINLKNNDGQTVEYAYCDVWQFSNGKLFKLTAFVISA